MLEILIKSLIAASLISVIASIIGCFVFWHKMGYFSDSMSHASIFGITLAFLFDITPYWGTFLTAFMFTVTLFFFERKVKIISNDILLGILSYTGMALGIIMQDFFALGFDLHALLFGSILFVLWKEIIVLAIFGVVLIGIVVLYWDEIVLFSLSREISVSERRRASLWAFLIPFLTACLIALSVQIVGTFLLASLLILPSAAARFWSKSPVGMIQLASVFAIISSFLGLGASYYLNTLATPSIVMAGSLLFVLSISSWFLFRWLKLHKMVSLS